MTDEDTTQETSSAETGPQTGTELALEWRDLMEMVNGEASRTIYYIIANLFDDFDRLLGGSVSRILRSGILHRL